MTKSVKFADDAFVNDARAIERSGRFDHTRISRVLAGEMTEEEKAVWSEEFLKKMSEPGPDEEAFFADLRKSGKAVGLDAAGNIVRANTQTEG
tara:strand:- start:1400 stop:1678 length:279 start_codon:yes stop_codon:yes gene_type:complete